MSDYIVRALGRNGGIRVLACITTDSAVKIASMQKPSPTASVALGRGIAAGALMGGLLKEQQRVGLKFEGNGPLKKMIIEAEHGGAVRASIGNPSADAEPVNGRFNVPAILGKAGFLTVSRDLGLGKEPYLGMVQLATSEIGDDLAYYLTDSEQIPSAVALSASLNSEGKLDKCCGFLVQALPGADDAEIDAIMDNISSLPPLTEIISADNSAESLIRAVFGDIEFVLLEKSDVFFSCSCSSEKVERALTLFGKEELGVMIEENREQSVTCEFCKAVYPISVEQLREILSLL